MYVAQMQSYWIEFQPLWTFKLIFLESRLLELTVVPTSRCDLLAYKKLPRFLVGGFPGKSVRESWGGVGVFIKNRFFRRFRKWYFNLLPSKRVNEDVFGTIFGGGAADRQPRLIWAKERKFINLQTNRRISFADYSNKDWSVWFPK